MSRRNRPDVKAARRVHRAMKDDLRAAIEAAAPVEPPRPWTRRQLRDAVYRPRMVAANGGRVRVVPEP